MRPRSAKEVATYGIIPTVDFKTILKPFFFVLMEALKKDYPLEYLKAGEEFHDTISELKTKINSLQKLL